MKVGIAGCSGRMGKMLLTEVLDAQDMTLVAASDRGGSDFIGKDAAVLIGKQPCGIVVSDTPEPLFTADAVIDFTRPEYSLELAALAARTGTALVIGTTGFSEQQMGQVHMHARTCRVLWSANMSLGVNILLGLTQKVAALLGEEYDIEIVEIHHRHKIDAPSGTALALGNAAQQGRRECAQQENARTNEPSEANVVFDRSGARVPGSIGYASLRGGDVVGDHTVIFAGEGERIELTHKASRRDIFARGALHAARWLVTQPNGFYTAQDWLG